MILALQHQFNTTLFLVLLVLFPCPPDSITVFLCTLLTSLDLVMFFILPLTFGNFVFYEVFGFPSFSVLEIFSLCRDHWPGS